MVQSLSMNNEGFHRDSQILCDFCRQPTASCADIKEQQLELKSMQSEKLYVDILMANMMIYKMIAICMIAITAVNAIPFEHQVDSKYLYMAIYMK